MTATAQTLNALTAATRASAQIVDLPKGPSISTARAPECAYIDPQAWAEDVYQCVSKSEHAQARVVQTRLETMAKIIVDRYGDTMPTYAQHRADHKQLEHVATLHCLADSQVLRKAWNISIKAAFGALPVSDEPSAVAKRLQAAAKPKAAKTEKVATGPQEHPTSASETVDQFIAKHGMGFVLARCAAVLAEMRETSLDAKTLLAVASHLKAA